VLFAPRGTPAPVVQAMHAAMSAALKSPDVVEKLRTSDQVVVAESPADTVTRLTQDSNKWGEVARRINLRLE
jgi:tripartite-type tricarboxylate transporter receptor subunit TctC